MSPDDRSAEDYDGRLSDVVIAAMPFSLRVNALIAVALVSLIAAFVFGVVP